MLNGNSPRRRIWNIPARLHLTRRSSRSNKSKFLYDLFIEEVPSSRSGSRTPRPPSVPGSPLVKTITKIRQQVVFQINLHGNRGIPRTKYEMLGWYGVAMANCQLGDKVAADHPGPGSRGLPHSRDSTLFALRNAFLVEHQGTVLSWGKLMRNTFCFSTMCTAVFWNVG